LNTGKTSHGGCIYGYPVYVLETSFNLFGCPIFSLYTYVLLTAIDKQNVIFNDALTEIYVFNPLIKCGNLWIFLNAGTVGNVTGTCCM
jgi:hypothetical protein